MLFGSTSTINLRLCNNAHLSNVSLHQVVEEEDLTALPPAGLFTDRPGSSVLALAPSSKEESDSSSVHTRSPLKLLKKLGTNKKGKKGKKSGVRRVLFWMLKPFSKKVKNRIIELPTDAGHSATGPVANSRDSSFEVIWQ